MSKSSKELTIEDKHKIILEIMIDIDRFCRENNIPYTISAGTMLGAIRHGGFIPWDDDADLFMLREDFDRFVKIYKSPKYNLLFNTRTEKEFLASGYAKVSDPSTAVHSGRTMTNYGVYVDIFPLDYLPEDEKERKKFMHKVLRVHNRLHHRQLRDVVSIVKAHWRSLDKWWNLCDSLVHSGKYDDSPIVGQVIGTDNYRTVLEKSRLKDMGDIEFEGHRFMSLHDPRGYLEMLYGKDYMTPVRWSHNMTIYQTDETAKKEEK